MKGLFLAILAAALVGCGSPAEPEATKADFGPKPKPAGFGPSGAPPAPVPATTG